MTRKEFPLSAGPEGAALSTGSTGASQVTPNTGGINYVAAFKGSGGAFGARFSNGLNAQSLIRALGTASNTKYGFNGVLTMPPELDTVNITVATWRHASGALGSIQINPVGDIVIYESGTTPRFWTLLNHLTAGWALGAKFRIKGAISTGSTTAGSFNFTARALGSTTILGTATASDANFTVNPIVGMDLGIVSGNNAASRVVGWADIVIDDGALTDPVDYFTSTTDVTPNSGAAPLAVTATVTKTATSGSTTTYAMAWGDGTSSPAQAGNTFTHTYTADGSFTATATVTNV